MQTLKNPNKDVVYKTTDWKQSNKILFIDDMETSHSIFKKVIDLYNQKYNTNFKIECYYNVIDLVSKSSGPYLCGFYDWNLSSTSIHDRGDVAIQNTGNLCFQKCILTRMYDDPFITKFATDNECFYIQKESFDEMSNKIFGFINSIREYLKVKK